MDFRAIEQASLVTGAPSFCGISRFSVSLSTPLLGSALGASGKLLGPS